MAYDKSFQTRVWPILISVFEQYVSPVFDGRLSKNVPASLAVFPVGVYQSQDGGGSNDDSIGSNGWYGPITFRCIDTTLSGAYNKALEVSEALQTITHPDYSISIKLEAPKDFPIEKITTSSIYTAGFIAGIGIYPKII